MQDLRQRLKMLRRPRILTIAARHGSAEYERAFHLQRLLKLKRTPGVVEAITRLLDLEKEMDQARQRRAGTYCFASHIEVISALMGEARLWSRYD